MLLTEPLRPVWSRELERMIQRVLHQRDEETVLLSSAESRVWCDYAGTIEAGEEGYAFGRVFGCVNYEPLDA